jgi:hypothetical protein
VKRVTVLWDTGEFPPDGWFLWLSLNGANPSLEGSVIEPLWIIHNRALTDKLGVGVQPFAVVDGMRLFGQVTWVNVAIDGSEISEPLPVGTLVTVMEDE